MLRKILMTMLLAVVGCQLFAHPEMSVGSAITDILGGDKTKVSEACQFLSTDLSDSTIVFATVALDGRLYASSQVGAVAQGADGRFTTLFGGAEVADSELKQIKLSRGDRRTLSPLNIFINLTSDNAQVRMAAYEELVVAADESAVEIMEHAVEVESNKAAKVAATQSLYKLYLAVGSEEQQAAAIDHINEDRNMEFSTALTAYVAREDISNTNRAGAKLIVKYFDMVARNNNLYQNLFSGLSLGSILILVSLGLSIVYGLAGIINMSHGEFLMIGAYTTYCVQQLFERFLPESWFDLSFFVSLPISFVVAALFGLLIERLVLKHLYSRPLESMLATLGISLILIQLARSIFGDLTTVKAPAILSGGISLGSGLILPYNRLFIIGLTIVIFVGVYLLFQRTRLGVRIRAVTQNRNMSACVGISTKKIDMITFMLGSGLAGIAGCAITLIGNVVPNMGQTYIVDSFLVVVTGGVGKLAGCAVSGLGIGVLSKFFEAGFEAVYGKVLILLLIIIFLQYRPKGLFADKGRIGDD
ncbi:MAG: urea ABC transporter permease subunit UrtB [Rikenellaceae bacterium]